MTVTAPGQSSSTTPLAGPSVLPAAQLHLTALPVAVSQTTSTTKGITRWLDPLVSLWDQTSIYLPVLLMGLLALISFWIVGITPSADLPAPERAISQAPDSIMRDFAIRQFTPDGTLKSELFGREMRRYPHNDTSVIDGAHGVQIADTGRRSTFQAQRLTTNDDQSIYWFEGNVIIIREAHYTPTSQDPRVEYRGEALTLYVDEDRLESDKPVVITRGADRISGNRLRYDDNTTVLNIQGRVRATLQPRTSP
jgi:lipopolysaccharide export system protein LptC